ncbi:MAG: ABC transporter permease subunit [Acidimicrobiales bacterium]
MIRLALRQFRTEAIVGLGLLVALAVVLAVTGPHLVSVSDAFKSTCRAAHDCATTNPVLNSDKALRSALPFIVVLAPALVGLFFGAPLIARELETGTFRLVWTQSVTRKRWLAAKLGLVGIVAMAIGGLLTWMADWWASPLDAMNQDRFGIANFSVHGIAPIGYAAFAFALGVTAGALLRRTVPAMAVTVAAFAVARVAVTYWVRPNLASPVRESLPLSAASGPGFLYGSSQGTMNFNAYIQSGVPTPGVGQVVLTAPQVNVPNGWVYSTSAVDKAGRAPTSHYLFQACPVLKQFSKPQSSSTAQLEACITRISSTLHTVVTYQPGSRFWPFQWAEMGIFLAGALALCGLTYWWLRRQYA